VLVAVAEGAILAAHLSSSVRLAFLSGCMFPERSSPSRVRFAAPNNGAPLTAPGRSARPSRQERKALWRTGCRWRHYPNAKMAPFLTATVTQREPEILGRCAPFVTPLSLEFFPVHPQVSPPGASSPRHPINRLLHSVAGFIHKGRLDRSAPRLLGMVGLAVS
jgi:hypothetical protein